METTLQIQNLKQVDVKENLFVNYHKKYDSLPITNGLLSQRELDLGKGRNTNIFAYRGQFSPDLIANLIDKYAKPESVILDPFCGCGTTLFEAGKQNHSAIGSDINPAGFIMGNLILLYNLDEEQRKTLITKAQQTISNVNESSFWKELVTKISIIQDNNLKILLANAFILSHRKKNATKNDYYVALSFLEKRINSFPVSKKCYRVINADARSTIVANNSVDLIITSPPYINVFNYHQHDRTSTEQLGFEILSIAKSEFGANRKNRQNRFLTVVQYILDMANTMLVLKKTLRKNGRFILVIGRESRVRGVPFRNDQIIATIAQIVGYKIILHQQRSFKNQFGCLIIEDILHFSVEDTNDRISLRNTLDEYAKFTLKRGLSFSESEIIKKELIQAINNTYLVKESPIFQNENSAF